MNAVSKYLWTIPDDEDDAPVSASQTARVSATPLSLNFHRTPPRRWLYGTSLSSGYVSMLGGMGGSGKSSFSMVVALSIATGKPLLGDEPQHRIVETGNVWIYNLEDPIDEINRRIAGIAAHYEIPHDALHGSVFVNSGRDTPLVIARRDQHRRVEIVAPVVDELVEELKAKRIKLLIVDPFRSCHEVAENDNGEMQRVMGQWSQVADASGCAVWLVHHFRKGGAGGDAESFAGAQSQQGSARSMETFQPMTGDEADRLGIAPEKRRRYVRRDDVKNNMAPAQAATWYHMASVCLDNATEDQPEPDWVGVVEPWTPDTGKPSIPAATLRAIFDAIGTELPDGARWSLVRQSSYYVGTLIIEKAGVDDHAARNLVKQWTESGLLKKVAYRNKKKRSDAFGIEVNPALAEKLIAEAPERFEDTVRDRIADLVARRKREE